MPSNRCPAGSGHGVFGSFGRKLCWIPESQCLAARDYFRACLLHLIRSGELLGGMLLSWNNTAFYQELMAAIRKAIAEGRSEAWAATTARLGGAV